MDSKSLILPEILIYTTTVLILGAWFYWRWNHRHYLDLAKKLPGPPSYPFLGTTSMFVNTYDGKPVDGGLALLTKV